MISEAVFWGSAGALVYSYALYPVLLSLVRRELPPGWESRGTPSVSLLLSVYNEEKHIAARIENLLALDYPAEKLEILIGSDGSDDRTNELAAQFADPRIRLHAYTQRTGKPGVLNRLAADASGELLAFTDANTMWEPDALWKLTRHFDDPQTGGVCGRLVFHGDGGETDEGPYWRLETFMKKRESDLDSCLGANGAIYAIRRAAWHGIPDNTLVDDFVIGMRVREQGLRMRYDSEAVANEDLPVFVRHEWTRRIRIGAGDFQALGLCWRSLLPWKGRYVWAFWSHKVLRWLGPFFMLGALLANALLVEHLFYKVTLALQLAFYAMALVGVWSRRACFSLPRYFVVINLALLLGFFRHLTGTQRAAWKRTAR